MTKIHPQTDALLVVDLQRDFLPGGALGVPHGEEIIASIAQLCTRFDTVVATQDFHPPGHVSFASSHPNAQPLQRIRLAGQREQMLWPDHCVQGSAGAALHPDLPDTRLTLILRKGTRREVDSYSAFREEADARGQRASTGLGAMLSTRGIRRLFVVGLARDYCVQASAVDAAGEGFETIVLDDLTRAVRPDQRASTDAAFAQAGVRPVLSRMLAA